MTCKKCLQVMDIPFGYEPTDYCHDCAQSLLSEAIEILECYASCYDGCTCGDGWNHEPARSFIGTLNNNE